MRDSTGSSMRWRERFGDAGFSTLEVVVSLVITSTVVLGSGAAMVTSARVTVASQQEVRYWTAIEYQAETLAASETLAAAKSSGTQLWTGTRLGEDGCEMMYVDATDAQIKSCLNTAQSGSTVGSDWQLTDAGTGRVLVIVDKIRPTDGLTKDTVVVYLHDSSP